LPNNKAATTASTSVATAPAPQVPVTTSLPPHTSANTSNSAAVDPDKSRAKGDNSAKPKKQIMAPRVARMQKRGIKEVTVVPPVKKVTKTTNSQTAGNSGNIGEDPGNNILPDFDGPAPIAQDAKSANIVQALKDLKDPYDPVQPNDYQEYCKERIRKQIEKERQAELQLQLQLQQKQETSKPIRVVGPNGVTAMSPFAERIMLKMGWKGRGHGLGKQEQGITAPLIAQKSGAGSQGIIINADANKQASQPAQPIPMTSNVIVLRNMVGPGEVDDMLCGETARECMKYGNVLECEVWEANAHNLPAEEAVRIFVRFEKPEQALQGRPFPNPNPNLQTSTQQTLLPHLHFTHLKIVTH